MKKTPLNKVSAKQKIELALRSKLKADFFAEHGPYCMTCGVRGYPPRWIELSHIIPLSRGGKTTRENCLNECEVCHDYFEKHPELREG